MAQKKMSTESQVYKLPKELKAADYLPNTIIIKVKPEFSISCEKNKITIDALNKKLQEIQAVQLVKMYPNHKKPLISTNRIGQKLVDLSLIYEFNFNANLSLEKAINVVLSSGVLEYAEPYYLPELLYSPNDPMKGSQYSLSRMLVYQAWDICKGDTNVIIGISDTGIDIDHPDLVGNIKYNYDDPIDGIDNDNDGFIDNYRGWDLGEGDNNPQVNYSRHGIWVSGIADASTDNGIGVCGVGFKSKILPCKIDNEFGSLSKSYQSIVYLADHGANIINCSWGGGGSSGQYGQDVINYAVINNNCLVIAACGNNGLETKYYPASYDNVLSVAATNSSDGKWYGNATTASTYNEKVDICAPGQGVYTTEDGGAYASAWGGTSFASPNVAGAAAIVKAFYPNFTGVQVGEQLKATADVIDTMAVNLPYLGKLGTGRVNLYKALTVFNKSSVDLSSVLVKDKNDSIFICGDTLLITASLLNYLAPTGNILATLSTASSLVSIIDGSTNFGVIGTMQLKSNQNDVFKVKINNFTTYNEVIPFTITYQDTAFIKTYNFNVVVNTDYVNLITKTISTSITSIGRIGFVDDSKTIGLGYLYNGSYSLTGCIGLVVGNASTQVSDAIYGLSGFSNMEDDFAYSSVVRNELNPTRSDYLIKGKMTDSVTGVNQVGVDVNYQILAWDSVGCQDYIIAEYKFKNRHQTPITNLYIGLYADWDITDSDKNTAAYDASNKMSYIYSLTSGEHYGAIKLLSEGNIKNYAIDNDGDFGSVNISDGFSSSEKWTALRTIRNNAGISSSHPDGNDVSQMLSTGPLAIIPNDSITVAFAIITGTSLIDIQQSAQSAQEKYSPTIGLNENILGKIQIFPNPANDNIYIELKNKKITQIQIFDALGREVMNKKEVVNNQISITNLVKGYYLVKVFTDNNETFQSKLIIK